MIECIACQTIHFQAFASFRLSSLAFWRQSFVPNEESFFFFIRRLMVINIHVYSFFWTESLKINTPCNEHALYLSASNNIIVAQ